MWPFPGGSRYQLHKNPQKSTEIAANKISLFSTLYSLCGISATNGNHQSVFKSALAPFALSDMTS